MSFGGAAYGKPQSAPRFPESAFERDIKAQIEKLLDTVRLAEEQLEAGRGGRLGGSFERFLSRGADISRETERLFREWTVHLAGEPAERQRRRVAQERLQRAFDSAAARLRDVRRRGGTVSREPAASVEEPCPLGGSESLVTEEEESLLAVQRRDGLQLQSLQSKVQDVSQIFRDFAVVVNEQGRHLDGIEAMAQSASEETFHAAKHLERSQRGGSSVSLYCGLAVAVAVVFALLRWIFA